VVKIVKMIFPFEGIDGAKCEHDICE